MTPRQTIPPWQDAPTLCANLCISEGTLENWTRKGLLPAPRIVGGKRLWKWSEVEAKIEAPKIQSDAERIYNDTREAVEGR